MRIGILYNTVERGEQKKGLPSEMEAENEVLGTVSAVRSCLENAGQEVLLLRVSADVLGALKGLELDVIFNLAEGMGGDTSAEYKIAALLELFEIPYTGANSLTLAVCNDKFMAKNIMVSHGLTTPAYQLIKNPDEPIDTHLEYPLIVKPVREDASIGICPDSVVYDESRLRERIRHVIEVYRQPALVEDYIDGREFNVAVLGSGENARPLPIAEIIFNLPPGAPKVVSYEAKWIEDSLCYMGTTRCCPADLEPHLSAVLVDAALKAYKAVGCTGYGRVDVRLKNGVPYVLEVNPNPCINPEHSGFVAAIEADGMDVDYLVREIINYAVKRESLIQGNSKEQVDVLKTKNLTLRPVGLADVDTLLRWFNDAENLRFMDGSGQTSRERLEIEMMKGSDEYDFMVLVGDRPVGFASIYNLDLKNMRGEISFLIGEREDHRRGYGSEIVGALVDFAFRELKLNSLSASATVLNAGSIKILTKAGFTKIGTRRGYHQYKDEFLDEVFFDITSEDYQTLKAQAKKV